MIFLDMDISCAGDIDVQNRVFGAFYVLLGAGIIAALFGIFSNSVMEQQEAVMQRRFVNLANSMAKVAADTATRMKKYQRRKLQEYYNEIEQMDAAEVTTFTRAKQQMFKYMLDQVLNGNSEKLQDMNLQMYEEELRQLRSKGLVDFLFVIIAVFSGALCMIRIEGWKFDDAFYWACVTVSTLFTTGNCSYFRCNHY
jgi:roadblock/LC7 domain-containing protein